MFANGFWGSNIRVPGSANTCGSTDLGPIQARLTAVESHNLSQQVTLDDLGLQMKELRETVLGGGGTSGDDPGMTENLANLDAQVAVLRADVLGFKQDQESLNNELIFVASQANNTATQNSSRIDAVILTNNDQNTAITSLQTKVDQSMETNAVQAQTLVNHHERLNALESNLPYVQNP